MSFETMRRLGDTDISSAFERSPEQELILLGDILDQLKAAGLYKSDLLYSGFNAPADDDEVPPIPNKVYVMTEADWRVSLADESAMIPPHYAEIAGENPAIAVYDSSKVLRYNGDPAMESTFHIPIIPKPEYSDITFALVAVILLQGEET